MSKYLASLFLMIFSLEVGAQSTASKQIEIFEFESGVMGNSRNIRLFLPESYAGSKKSYPVIYMHDAQNLFDAETSFAGEWEVDEFLERNNSEIIVVGIDHANEDRIAELTPFANEKYGGGQAEKYLEFIISELKPHIDNNFRTQTQAAHTGIFGSSLGGLVSFYAAVKHPEVFGIAGVFSPSFWFSDDIYEFAKASEIPESSKFYFLAGTEESEKMIEEFEKMKKIISEKLPKKNFKFQVIEGGKHNEALWRENFPKAFNWLFEN